MKNPKGLSEREKLCALAGYWYGIERESIDDRDEFFSRVLFQINFKQHFDTCAKSANKKEGKS